LIGTFLFHSLFITAQSAASRMFGDSAVGEYFRAFLSYGVIAVALIMYAWRAAQQKKAAQRDLTAGAAKE
jgi:simple sugar transport system permease protein